MLDREILDSERVSAPVRGSASCAALLPAALLTLLPWWVRALLFRSLCSATVCHDCGSLTGVSCPNGKVLLGPDMWMRVEPVNGTVQAWQCPPGLCESVEGVGRCHGERKQDASNLLCGECLDVSAARALQLHARGSFRGVPVAVSLFCMLVRLVARLRLPWRAGVGF